jgi:MFS family permease
MGLIGYAFSYQAIFLLVVVLTLPVFVALARIHATDIHFGRSCGAPQHHTFDRPTRAGRTSLWKSPGLQVLAVCLFLFQLSNASMLPLAGESLIYQGESRASLIVSALIVLPQIVVAALAPWVGREANNLGRRPLLLIGFGALPVRALLFALIPEPQALLAFQLLDGVSGAVIGVLTALVIADLTNDTGRFNLAQGLVGTASGVGASLSTALFGVIAMSYGRTVVFLSIAASALVAVWILWILMPETRPATKPVGISE